MQRRRDDTSQLTTLVQRYRQRQSELHRKELEAQRRVHMLEHALPNSVFCCKPTDPICCATDGGSICCRIEQLEAELNMLKNMPDSCMSCSPCGPCPPCGPIPPCTPCPPCPPCGVPCGPCAPCPPLPCQSSGAMIFSDMECVRKLDELTSNELQMRKRIKDLEHREFLYMETLKRVEEQEKMRKEKDFAEERARGSTAALEIQIGDLKEMNEKLKEENERMRKLLGETGDEIKDLQTFRKESQQMESEIQKDIRKSEEQVQSAVEDLNTMKTACDNLKDEIKTLKRIILDVKTALDSQKQHEEDLVSELKNFIERLETQLKEANTNLNDVLAGAEMLAGTDVLPKPSKPEGEEEEEAVAPLEGTPEECPEEAVGALEETPDALCTCFESAVIVCTCPDDVEPCDVLEITSQGAPSKPVPDEVRSQPAPPPAEGAPDEVEEAVAPLEAEPDELEEAVAPLEAEAVAPRELSPESQTPVVKPLDPSEKVPDGDYGPRYDHITTCDTDIDEFEPREKKPESEPVTVIKEPPSGEERVENVTDLTEAPAIVPNATDLSKTLKDLDWAIEHVQGCPTCYSAVEPTVLELLGILQKLLGVLGQKGHLDYGGLETSVYIDLPEPGQ